LIPPAGPDEPRDPRIDGQIALSLVCDKKNGSSRPPSRLAAISTTAKWYDH
jgi:hypothetical protein